MLEQIGYVIKVDGDAALDNLSKKLDRVASSEDTVAQAFDKGNKVIIASKTGNEKLDDVVTKLTKTLAFQIGGLDKVSASALATLATYQKLTGGGLQLVASLQASIKAKEESFQTTARLLQKEESYRQVLNQQINAILNEADALRQGKNATLEATIAKARLHGAIEQQISDLREATSILQREKDAINQVARADAELAGIQKRNAVAKRSQRQQDIEAAFAANDALLADEKRVQKEIAALQERNAQIMRDRRRDQIRDTFAAEDRRIGGLDAARSPIADANQSVFGDNAQLKEQIALLKQGKSAQEALTTARLRAQGVDESSIQTYVKQSAEIEKLTNKTAVATNKFQQFVKSVATFTVGLTIFSALTGAVAGFDDLIAKTEQLQIVLATTEGSAVAASAKFEQLREVAKSLALPQLQLVKGFADFSIAAKGSSLSAAEVETAFLQVSKAAAGAGLSAENTEGVFRALTQIMSKGKLQAEELRGQLGDRLPGAFTLMARGLNVTTAELDDMLKKGLVPADAAIKAFGAEVERTFGPAAEKRFSTYSGSLENLKNAFSDLAIDNAADLVGPLSAAFNALASAVKASNVVFLPLVQATLAFGAAALAAKTAIAGYSLVMGLFTVQTNAAGVATTRLTAALALLSKNPAFLAFTVVTGALILFWSETKKAEAEQQRLNDTMKEASISAGLLKEQLNGTNFEALVRDQDIDGLKNYRTALEQLQATERGSADTNRERIEAQKKIVKQYEESQKAVGNNVVTFALEAAGIAVSKKEYEAARKALADYTAQNDTLNPSIAKGTEEINKASRAIRELSGQAEDSSAGGLKSVEIQFAAFGDKLGNVLQGLGLLSASPAWQVITGATPIKPVKLSDTEEELKALQDAGIKGLENLMSRRAAEKDLNSEIKDNVRTYEQYTNSLKSQGVVVQQAAMSEAAWRESVIKSKTATENQRKALEDKLKTDKTSSDAASKRAQEETKKALEKLQALRDVNELLRAGIPLEQAQQQVQKEAIALTGKLKDEYINLSKENRNLEDIRKSTIASAEKELQIKERLLKSESDMRAAIQQRIAVQGGAKLEDLQPKEQNSITDQIKKIGATVGPLTQEMSADLIVLKNKLVELNETDLSKALDVINKLYKDSLSLSALDISGVFGKIGNPFEEAFAGLQNLMDAQETYDKMRKEKGADLAKINFLQSQNEIKQVANILGASKKLFKEKSAGYKAVSAVEKTVRAIELANTIKQIFTEGILSKVKIAGYLDSAKTSVIAAATEIGALLGIGQAAAVTGVATQAAGDPYTAFGRMAAMAAIMGGLGFAVSGGFGGSGGSKGQSAAERQAVQGTGSVLGDVKGQSESLVNALTQIRELESADLQISKGMLTSLRNIESSIGGFVNVLFRANSATGTASPFAIKPSTSNDKLGGVVQGASKLSPTGLIGNILEQVGIPDIAGGLIKGIIGGIFGSTKIKQIDSGINIAAQNLGDILAGNFAGTYYATIQKTKKKLFGLSKSSSTSELTQELDDGVSSQLILIFQNITDAVVQGVAAFGVSSDAALQQLQAIELEFQKISLEGLSAEDAQAAVANVFGAFADNIVGQILPSVEQFQRAGEGLFETLSRVASETFAIQEALKNLGLASMQLGLSTVEAYQNLIELSGGIDALGNNLSGFYDNFLSEDQQFVNTQRQIEELFASLEQPIPALREDFTRLVQSLDLTSESGQEAFAALISAQSVANEYYQEIEKLTPSMEDAANALSDFLDKLKDVQNALLRTQIGLSGGSQTGFDVGVIQQAIRAAKSTEEVLALIGPLSDALKSVYAEQLQGIEKTKNAQIEAIRSSISLEKTALETQQEALKKQIDSSEKLRDLAVSIRDYATGLRINANTSTGNPFTRLAAAQAEFTRLAQAAKTGDVVAAGKVTGAASDVLETAKEVFASSTGYASIFNATEKTLNDLTGILSSSQSDSTLLASIDAQILALTSKQDMQIAAVEAAAAAQQALAKLQFQQQIGILLQAVNLLEILGDSASDADLTALKDAIISGTAPLAGVIAELTRTANETVTRNIRIIVESSIPDEVKRLALLTNESVTKTINAAAGAMEQEALVVASLQTDTVTRTVNAVQGGTLTAETAAIVFARTDTLTRTIAASAGAFPQVAKDILYATSASVTRTINAALGTGNAQALQIALLQSDTITRTVNAVQGGTLSPAVAAIVFAQTDSLTRTVNAVTGNLDQSTRDLIYAASSSVTRYVNAAMGNSDTDALRVALATSDTVTRTINAALQGGALTPDQRAVLEAINGSTTASLNATVALRADGSLTDPLEAIKDNTSADEKGITSWLKSMNVNLNAIRLNTGAGSGEPGGQSNVSGAPAQGAVFWLELIYNRLARLGENVYRAVENLDGTSKGYGTRAPAYPAYALGGVFTNSIVSQPTLFNPSLMGEAGPEAIMPLSRTSDGSLGVRTVSAANDSGETVNELKEINRQQSALIRLQQEANKQMIAKLTQIEDRLAGVESKARLQAAA